MFSTSVRSVEKRGTEQTTPSNPIYPHSRFWLAWSRSLHTLRELELSGMVLDGGLVCRLIKRNRNFSSFRLTNVYIYCAEGIALLNDGKEEGVVIAQRDREAEKYLKDASGIDDVRVLMCELRSGQMPEFEGWETIEYSFGESRGSNRDVTE